MEHSAARHPSPASPRTAVRLFVAVEIPDRVRSAVDRACAPLRARHADLRWIPAERWHLTLVFLGAVPVQSLDAVAAAVRGAAAGVSPFPLVLDGRLGTFRSGVLWAGLAPSVSLATLAGRLRSALADTVVLPDEDRPFRAHLTLARAPRGVRVTTAAVRDVEVPALGWQVDAVVLFESQLRGRHGPRYIPRLTQSLSVPHV